MRFDTNSLSAYSYGTSVNLSDANDTHETESPSQVKDGKVSHGFAHWGEKEAVSLALVFFCKRIIF